MRWCLILVMGSILVVAGCRGSRWAKRDADYRQKYPQHTDDPIKTLKQAVDARHVDGKSGAYVSLAGRGDPFAGGWDMGGFRYPQPWFEQRLGFSGLVHEGGEMPVSLGLLGSCRWQVPSRLAPFAGVGVYGGWAGGNFEYSSDDGWTLGDDQDFVFAAFPEVGTHFWIDHRRRLTFSTSYWMTNQDYNENFLFFTVGLSWFGDEYQKQCAEPIEEFTPISFPPPAADAEPVGDSPYGELTIVEPGSMDESPE